MIRKPLFALSALAVLLAGPASAASLTPPNLVQATGAANADLMLIWPTASVGPLEALSWANLKTQLNTDLSFLKAANNLSDVGNPGISRTNLGLGTAAIINTGTSGATIPLLNGANTWSGVQSFNSSDLLVKGATSGTLTINCAATCGARTLTFPAGTTDFSATGGTSQVVKQVTAGAALTVGQLACTDLSGVAASCSTDATNASNISSGTLAAARGGAGTVTGILQANGSGTVSAITVGTGLSFSGGTLTATAASAGTQGSWTPNFSFATNGNLSVSYNAGRFGTYTCVNVTGGSLVEVEAHITASAFTFTTASGALLMGSLPYAITNTGNAAGGTITFTNSNVTWTGQLSLVVADSTHFGINKLTSGSVSVAMSTSSFATGSPPTIDFTATYQSASAC